LVPALLRGEVEAWGIPGGRGRAEGTVALGTSGFPEVVELRSWSLGEARGRARLAVAGGVPMDLVVGIETLDLAAWLREFEPLVARINAELSEPAVPVPGRGSAGGTASGAPAPWGLPDLRVALESGWVDLGGGHALARVQATFASTGGWPERLAVAAQVDGVEPSLSWDSRDNALAVHLPDLGKLLAAAAAPLDGLAPATVPQGSAFALLRELPVTVRGGDLGLRGRWRPREAEGRLEGSSEVRGLRLERDVETLNRIAGLVKRRVVLYVPFERLAAGSFRVGSSGVVARDIVLQGPVDIALESAEYRSSDTLVQARGKVFGVCFEIHGPAAGPRFYLCDDSTVVRILTEEEEEW
jgi:hypothetical protein